MPLTINPEHLKKPAYLTSRIKEMRRSSSTNSALTSVHRLRSNGNRLGLFTTDGTIFLEWYIQVIGGEAEEIDILVSADHFNAMATKSSGETYYSVRNESKFLHFNQGRRDLRLELKQFRADPPPPEKNPGSRSWTVEAAPLAKALEFVIPFSNSTNRKASRSVITWRTDGSLVTGSVECSAFASGLPAPLITMNFDPRAAEALKEFLKLLEGHVEVAESGVTYSFTCTEHGHRLLFQGEITESRNSADRLDAPNAEEYTIRQSSLLSGLDVLGAVLPDNNKRLDLLIRGQGDEASLRLTTVGAEDGTSKDEFAIHRKYVDPTAPKASEPVPDTRFTINGKLFRWALSRLKSENIVAKYDPEASLLQISESDCDEGDIQIRTFILSVQKPRPLDQNQAVKDSDSEVQSPTPEPSPSTSSANVGSSGNPDSNKANPPTSKK